MEGMIMVLLATGSVMTKSIFPTEILLDTASSTYLTPATVRR